MPERTCLVTGAAGFVGSAVVEAVHQTRPGWKVVCVDRVEPPVHAAGGEWRVVDLTQPASVVSLLRDVAPDIVIHLGGLARGTDLEALYAANVRTTLVLLEAATEVLPGAVWVVPGSAAEYGPVPVDRLPVTEDEPLAPVSPYGVSKAWQTVAALSFRARGLDVRVARPFNIIGPGLPESFALGAFAHRILQAASPGGSGIVKTGYLGSRRDFLDVRDVALGLLAVAERGRSGATYNVCSGTGVSMRECLDTLLEVAGVDVTVDSAEASNASEIDDSVGSNARLVDETGWSPTITLRQSILEYWEGLVRAKG